jgi:hypothetical protein
MVLAASRPRFASVHSLSAQSSNLVEPHADRGISPIGHLWAGIVRRTILKVEDTQRRAGSEMWGRVEADVGVRQMADCSSPNGQFCLPHAIHARGSMK